MVYGKEHSGTCVVDWYSKDTSADRKRKSVIQPTVCNSPFLGNAQSPGERIETLTRGLSNGGVSAENIS